MSSKKTANKPKNQTPVPENKAITQYFSKIKRPEPVIEVEESERLKLADQFYQISLEEQRCESICDKQKCIDLKSELRAQLRDMQKNVVNTKMPLICARP